MQYKKDQKKEVKVIYNVLEDKKEHLIEVILMELN